MTFKYAESKFIKDLKRRVLTPYGYQTIESIHKTIPLQTLRIRLSSGNFVDVAYTHTFVVDGVEISACDLEVGSLLQAVEGYDEVVGIEDLGIQTLYDITLDESEFDNQTYYTNGVLSHNSGKSITVACYLAWLFNFNRDKNIGIVANRMSQAREFLRNTKDIFSRLPMWMMQGITEWNKSMIAAETGMRIMTDVPSSDSFRGHSLHCVCVDECAFIKDSSWQEFADSIFPSQSALAWKKNIIISTAKGLNHFYDIVQRSKLDMLDRGTENYNKSVLVEVDWREVPRYDSEGNQIDSEAFKASIIKKYGRVYFEQNYGNSFIGSAETLLDPEVLNAIEPSPVLRELGPGLKIYEEPQEGHTYLMGIDGSKDGKDAFAVQIFDVTSMPFRQVASAQLQVNYLEMPEYLYEWGGLFNTAMMVIENNEGAGQSCADTLQNFFEYPNLYKEPFKKYPGFRTTAKSRETITKLLQVMGNTQRLQFCDAETISEFLTFELVNGKYQASGAAHDDLVMATAVMLAPLSRMDNFEDYGKFLKSLKSTETVDTKDFFSFGDMMFEDM